MRIAHFTDTHVTVPGQLVCGRVDTNAMLARGVQALLRMDPQPDLVVLTGDLVEGGRPEEYAHLRGLLAPLHLPCLVVPGNHDEREALRASFHADGYLGERGLLHYALDDRFALRIIGLDTLVPGAGHGELGAQQLAWLDASLARLPARPTLLLLHHPPFDTGIGPMDALGLVGREHLAVIVERHRQVQAMLCGHVHRCIMAQVAGRPAMTAPSTAHQINLDLRAEAALAFRLEPPGFLLHLWDAAGWVTHHALIDEFAGPFAYD